MALGWTTLRALPRLSTYADAVKWEADTKPIRGDKYGTKPLGRRNQKWRFIKREDDDIVVGHGSPANPHSYDALIRYKPNGEIHLHTYYPSATNNEVLSNVLGWRVHTYNYATWVETQAGWLPLRKRNRTWDTTAQTYVYGDEISNVFIQTSTPSPRRSWGYDQPTMLNPNYPITHHVNRAGARAARQTYAPFSAYCAAMRKLRGDRTSRELLDEVNAVFGENHNDRPKSPGYWGWNNEKHTAILHHLMTSDDPEQQYKALVWADYCYNNSGVPLHKLIDRVAFTLNYEQCLTKEIATSGKLVRDRYAWAAPAPTLAQETGNG